MSWAVIGAVAVGGALGSVGRHVVSSVVGRAVGMAFPWGTLAVNVIGGFVIGALVEVFALRWSVTPEIRAFLITGILGGFTTFSAFSLEIVAMIERGAWAPAASYIVASVALSLLATFAGLWAMRAALA